jgi:subtilisin family serine protease
MMRGSRKFLGLCLLALSILFPSMGMTGGAQDRGRPLATREAPYAPEEVLVKYRKGVPSGVRAMDSTQFGARVAEIHGSGIHRVKLPPGVSVREAVEMFRANRDVEAAEPNYIVRALAAPNDPDFHEQWGLSRIDARGAWSVTTGSADVVIAVLDTGLALAHPDLVGNIWRNPGEIAGNGLDDDGNGLVDDTRGWDFIAESNRPMDHNGHGTHVAGILGAVGNNHIDIAGTAWTVSIMPLRFLDSQGAGSVFDAVSAIDYARQKGARVINASYGSPFFSRMERDAIEEFCLTGGLFVAAAGNRGNAEPTYPASYDLPCIISVAATDENDALAAFSSFDPVSVDLGAPGTDILSTLPARDALFADDFDDGDLAGWTSVPAGAWGLAKGPGFVNSPPWSLTDSPGGTYAPNTDTWAYTPPIDLSSRTGCQLEYAVRLDIADGDALDVEAADNASFSGSVLLSRHSLPTTTFHPFSHALTALEGEPRVFVRFRLLTDAGDNADGVYIDDVSVTCISETGGTVGVLSGTSAAAPFVSGVAGLLLARTPTLTGLEVRESILDAVDVGPGLSGKVLTDGRLNAGRALTSATPLVAPSGLTAAAASPTRIDLHWRDNSSLEDGYRLERKEAREKNFIEVALTGPDAVSYADTSVGPGELYTYRVRAAKGAELSSYSNQASASTFFGGNDGCFIATAAYGSPLAKDVVLLKRFRDRVLITNPPGRALVRLYYRLSPPLARVIARHEPLKRIVRVSLWPLVYGIKYPLRALFTVWAAFALILAGRRRR